MKFTNLTACAAAAAAVAFAGGVHAANLYFSFSNVIGNVAGTVSGEIFGLNPNGASAPTDIVVDSYPAALVESGNYPTPVDIFKWTGGGTQDSDTFTLSGGNFVSGGFSIYGANGDIDQLYINSVCCVGADTNYFDIGSGNNLYVWNDNGVGPGGITFSVPEPATWAMMLLGLGGLGAAMRSRRHPRAAAAA